MHTPIKRPHLLDSTHQAPPTRLTRPRLFVNFSPAHSVTIVYFFMEEAQRRISSAVEAAKASGLTEGDIDQAIDRFYEELTGPQRVKQGLRIKRVLGLTVRLLLYRILPISLLISTIYYKLQLLVESDPCLVAQPIIHDFASQIIDCRRCRNISKAVTIDQISVIDFMNDYATTLQPVLMKGAASDWPALKVFSYEYFKGLYLKKPDAINHDVEEGQFFSYSSGIFRLDEFMSLDNETASLKRNKWYIGW